MLNYAQKALCKRLGFLGIDFQNWFPILRMICFLKTQSCVLMKLQQVLFYHEIPDCNCFLVNWIKKHCLSSNWFSFWMDIFHSAFWSICTWSNQIWNKFQYDNQLAIPNLQVAEVDAMTENNQNNSINYLNLYTTKIIFLFISIMFLYDIICALE